MKKLLWWEQIVDQAEDCKDLEWLAYNGGGTDIEIELNQNAEWFSREIGPISEQVWAIREGLA